MFANRYFAARYFAPRYFPPALMAFITPIKRTCVVAWQNRTVLIARRKGC